MNNFFYQLLATMFSSLEQLALRFPRFWDDEGEEVVCDLQSMYSLVDETGHFA
jgi:hypothetical protein